MSEVLNYNFSVKKRFKILHFGSTECVLLHTRNKKGETEGKADKKKKKTLRLHQASQIYICQNSAKKRKIQSLRKERKSLYNDEREGEILLFWTLSFLKDTFLCQKRDFFFRPWVFSE